MSPVVQDSCGSCRRCVDNVARLLSGYGQIFIVCVTCGNKRCPKATDHRNECTGSNAPGQEGSELRMNDLKSQLDLNERETAQWPEWKRQAAAEDFPVGELPEELLEEVSLKFLARPAVPGSSRDMPRPRTRAVTAHDIADFIRDRGHARVVTIDEAGSIGFAPAWVPAREPIPTVETIADTQARLLDLTSRRLIQFLDARNAALKLLDPPAKDGVKPAPDVAGAIRVLEGTRVLG